MKRYLTSWIAGICCVVALAATQTSIPTLRLTYDEATINDDTYVVGTLTYTLGTYQNPLTYSYSTKVRYRGSTERNKKSYTLKLIDSSGTKVDASLFGMRTDNYWILDAMATDRSRLRNLVSQQLWLDFSAAPYWADDTTVPTNGVNGYLVALYLNDSFNGVYCLSERVDRKQLKLKKIKDDGTLRGMLFKADEKTTTTEMQETGIYSASSDSWLGFEAKYPELGDDVTSITWSPLYDNVNFVATATTSSFAGSVASTYDLPVLIDYFLFVELLGAQDNTSKDIYYSIYNQNKSKQMSVTPWNMDHSWGRLGSNATFSANGVIDWDNQLFARLKADYSSFETAMQTRWTALRSTYFKEANLQARFAEYFSLLQTTGMAEAEAATWGSDLTLDFEAEQTYINEWITARLAALDKQLFGDYSGVTDIRLTHLHYASLPMGGVVLSSEENIALQILTITGTPVQTLRLSAGETATIALPTGMYLLQTDTGAAMKFISR